MVQTIILNRISGRTRCQRGVSVRQHTKPAFVFTSVRVMWRCPEPVAEHYPAQHPWRAICAWVGQTKNLAMSLEQMAAVTQQEKLIHNTFVVSPALGKQQRSRLYHPEHAHLFRPQRLSSER